MLLPQLLLDCGLGRTLHEFCQLVMREGLDGMAINTRHGLGGDHGVDNGFLRGFDGRLKQGTDALVGNSEDGVRTRFFIGAAIGSGEGNENVAGGISRDGAGAGKPHRGPARQPLQLRGQ